jgi:hypothetical protein
MTIPEVLIVLALVVVLLGIIISSIYHAQRTTHVLAPRLGLQQASRKAIVRLLRELQEGMEVIRPRPGSTVSYALVRDKMSLTRWYYQVTSSPPSRRSFELWRYVDDWKLPEEKRAECLLRDVQRLTFTSSSEGALQVHMLLGEGDQEYGLLTTVRLRNLASSEELW